MPKPLSRRQCGRRGNAEHGEERRQRGFGHADPAGHGGCPAQHPRADLHDHQLGKGERLSEREEAEPEDRGVDEVAGEVAAEEL